MTAFPAPTGNVGLFDLGEGAPTIEIGEPPFAVDYGLCLGALVAFLVSDRVSSSTGAVYDISDERPTY